jgi:hypothetical protein
VDAHAPIRSRMRAYAEERQHAAGDRASSRTDDAWHEARSAAAVYWALHPDPATAAAQATNEALFAGCERAEIEAAVRQAAAERPPS